MSIRKGLLGMALVLGLACSDDVPGKKNGEPCVGHEECASGLCTSVASDGGAADAGIGKRCAEPGLTP